MKIIYVILTCMLMMEQTSAQIQYVDAYPILITADLKTSKDFYQKWLDFDVAFEATWFVYMKSKGTPSFTFALIDETHPSSPPSYGSFNGRGAFLTLQVDNAQQVYDRLKQMNAPISYPLTKEDWGQLRFGLTDPNGLYIDIVEQIEPATGYWDQYIK